MSVIQDIPGHSLSTYLHFINKNKPEGKLYSIQASKNFEDDDDDDDDV